MCVCRAGITLGSYWFIGLPLAALLGLHWGQGAAGMWLAMAIATTVQAAALAAVMVRLDWRGEALAAQRRVAAATPE